MQVINWLFNCSSSLVDIDLHDNPLGGHIPDAFGNMMSLESLNLESCALEYEIPKSFRNLSRLRSLELSVNNLTGQLPELFQMLVVSKNSLELLALNSNNFIGSLTNFTRFSSLSKLFVNNNKLQGSFLKKISSNFSS